MTTINIGNWTNLDVNTMTNIFLYGQQTTPVHYVERLRTSAQYSTDTPLTVELDAVSYMEIGPGRYAHASDIGFVQDFYAGTISLAAGSYTRDELINNYGYELVDFSTSYGQYQIDPTSADYEQRTYVFNTTGFAVSGDTVFIVNADGSREIQNLALLPTDDNFDFDSGNPLANLGNDTVLEPNIDPYTIGRRVEIEYTTESKALVPRVANYNYLQDQIGAANEPTVSAASGIISAFGAMQNVIDDLKAAGTIEYDTPSGGKVIYGSVEDDVSVTGTKFGDIIVTGDGDDNVFGTIGDDKLFGGSAEDNSTNDTLSYFFVNKGLNVLFTAPAEAGTIYTQGLKILGNNFTYTDLAYGFEKLILTESIDRVRFTNGDLSQNYFIDGGGDIDTLDFSGMTSSVNVDVINGTTNGSITFTKFENFIGGSANDNFIDAAGAQEYNGLAGIDTLSYAEQDALQISGGMSSIRIEADLAKGTVDRSLIQGGQKELDIINNVEKIIGASGDDVFKGKEGMVGQGFTGNGQTTEYGDVVDFSIAFHVKRNKNIGADAH